MLIAIFALLLISVVAIALVISSGTDSALAGNYRTSTSAYYAGLAGLEEARGRMLWRNPDFLNLVVPNFIPTPGGQPIPHGEALYIINPAGGETIAPTNLGSPNTYPDLEYASENASHAPPPGSAKIVNSVSGNTGVAGPLYKWVRITPATEYSLGIDINQDGNLDDTIVVYFDPAHATMSSGLKPSLIVPGFGNPLPGTARQVFQVTSLAVLPNRTEKLLQYVVTPMAVGLYFHGALELPGNSVVFNGPTSQTFLFNGNDTSSGTGIPPALPTCNPAGAPMAGIGVTDPTTPMQNYQSVRNGIPPNPPPPPAFSYQNNYIGAAIGPPSIQENVYVNMALRTPQTLSQMVTTIAAEADTVIYPDPLNPTAPATEADLPSAMSPSNPMTIVVQRDLNINAPITGYGLLVVTGNLTINADAGWKGIVMVVGKGNVTLAGGPGGSSQFVGAMFVAQIYDPTQPGQVLLPALGDVSFNATNASGRGIYYDSCWINAAQLPTTFKVLSFREIPYNN